MSEIPRLPREAFEAKVRQTVFVRIWILTALVLTTLVTQSINPYDPLANVQPLVHLVLSIELALNIGYLVYLKTDKPLSSRFLFMHFILDLWAATAIVYFTGTLTSLFGFLYIIIIISVGIFFSQRESIIIATHAMVLLGALVLAQTSGFLTPHPYDTVTGWGMTPGARQSVEWTLLIFLFFGLFPFFGIYNIFGLSLATATNLGMWGFLVTIIYILYVVIRYVIIGIFIRGIIWIVRKLMKK